MEDTEPPDFSLTSIKQEPDDPLADIKQEFQNEDFNIELVKLESLDSPTSQESENLAVEEIKLEQLPDFDQFNLDKVKMYKCLHCKFRSKGRTSIKDHLTRKHSLGSPKLFHCHYCKYKAKVKNTLQKHLANNHSVSEREGSGELLKCLDCFYETKRKYCLEQHVLMKHSKGDKKKEGDFDWNQHIGEEYVTMEQTKFNCSDCTFVTKTLALLDEHILRKHTADEQIKQWYYCTASNCSYKAKVWRNLQQHVKKMHYSREMTELVKVFKCTICLFQDVNRVKVHRHLLITHQTPENYTMYKCTQCSFETKWKESFQEHLFRKHSTTQEVDSSSITKFLETHVSEEFVTSEKVQLNKCPYCFHKTKREQDLKNHILLKHNLGGTVRWFLCTRCSFRSNIKSNLKKHLQTQHEAMEEIDSAQVIYEQRPDCGEIKMECEEIPPSSQQENPSKELFEEKNLENVISENEFDVDQHVVLVSETDEFQCKQCSYKTKKKSVMKQHLILRHVSDSQISWLQCPHCSYRAKIKATLKMHILRLHTTRQLKCPLCSYVTKMKDYLKQHILRKHVPPEMIEGDDGVEKLRCSHCKFEASGRKNMFCHTVLKHGDSEEVREELLQLQSLTKKAKPRIDCPHCDFWTQCEGGLKVHISTKHPPREVMYKCKLCLFETSNKFELSRHIINHQNLPSVSCNKQDPHSNEANAIKEDFDSS